MEIKLKAKDFEFLLDFSKDILSCFGIKRIPRKLKKTLKKGG